MTAGPPAELAYYLQACAGIDIVGASSVNPTMVALIRGDLVVWAGPVERIGSAPKDCRRLVLNVDEWRAWYGPKDPPDGTD